MVCLIGSCYYFKIWRCKRKSRSLGELYEEGWLVLGFWVWGCIDLLGVGGEVGEGINFLSLFVFCFLEFLLVEFNWKFIGLFF